MKCILSKGKLPLFNIDNYEIEKQIGEGSFGLIFRVVNKKTNIKYAMKKIIANNLTALESYQKEFEIVHQNSHEYILDILGICLRCLDQTTYVLYVLMDLALYDWDYEIEQRKKSRKFYKEEELISILRQISSALVFLQREKKIAHRDIKPENILVFKNGIYKLGDFGEAKVNRYMRNNARSTIRGTEMYMSPILFKSLQENMDDVQHDIYKSDVFSLGYCFVYAAALDFKIIYEIRNLNSDFKVKKILQRIFFLKYSNDFIELLLKMICNKEEDRVDFIGLEKLLEKEHFK
jgi:serine/threonine protein kinase